MKTAGCKCIPDIIPAPEFITTEIYKNYENNLYKVMHDDFIDHTVYFLGKKVLLDFYKIQDGKSDTFFHVLCGDKKEYPNLKAKDLGKKSQQYLAQNRIRFGAKRKVVDISPREWQAIQAGAISETALNRILRYAKGDQVREYATPRSSTTLTTGQKARIRAMKNSGYTQAQIAASLGVSASTVNKILNQDLDERRKQDV